MKIKSPYTGKPMRTLYEPDTWKLRGEVYNYIRISFEDTDNGERFSTTESDTVGYNQVTNQYRKRHGIPFTDEIIALRKRYGLSASKMSEVLGFGANQWRLYETGELPGDSNGKMIRSAMNPKVMLDIVKHSKSQFSDRDYIKLTTKIQNVIEQHASYHKENSDIERLFSTERGEWNGYAPQSTARLKNLLLCVLDKFGETFKTQMNKLLFYIDFLSYRERGIAISGLGYMAIEFGPIPQKYERVYSEFDEVEQVPKMIHDYEGCVLLAGAKADMSLFSEAERQIIDEVCDHFKGCSARQMSKISHQEPVWKNHVAAKEQLPFNEAFTLVSL